MGMCVVLQEVVTDKSVISKMIELYSSYEDTYDQMRGYRFIDLDEDRTERKDDLVNLYQKHVFTMSHQEVDWTATLEANHIPYNVEEDSLDIDYIFRDDSDYTGAWKVVIGKIVAFIDPDTVIRVDVEKCHLLVKEHAEFKGCYKEGFWQWSKLDDFDEEMNRYEAKDYHMTKAQVEELATHFDADADIHTWQLAENQFIYLSW